jgi:hypothetical protein
MSNIISFGPLINIFLVVLLQQEAILLEGYKFLRIDGTTKISERQRIVKVQFHFSFVKVYVMDLTSSLFFYMHF